MIRSRLYVKIYLTVIGSLAIVVISLSTLAVMGRLDTKGPLEDRIDRFASVMMSDARTLTERQRRIDQLSLALDADISLYDPQDHFLQGSGRRPDAFEQKDRFHPARRTYTATLGDGTRIVATMRSPFAPPRRNMIVAFLIIAAVIGIAAYPVVRNLTRRLDRLRQSMMEWGDGNLGARAPVSGNDEITTVARTFNQAADRIEALVTSQKNLLANASHELRSPLARLRMATEMFDLARNDDNRKEIVRNLAELDELVEEILLKSRLESNQPPQVDQFVDLLPLAAEEAALVEASVEGSAVSIKGNEKLIRRAMRNLLQNAVRHGRPPVSITVSEHGNFAAITVRDHGDGLNPDEMQRIFEPFFRPAGHAESSGGWGLGLSLVAQIAALHGGRAYVARPDGDGGCVVLEIRKS